MTSKRKKELMDNCSLELTKEEIDQGYIFCNEFDGLLVNINSGLCKRCDRCGVKNGKGN